jgi:hypothetical protein
MINLLVQNLRKRKSFFDFHHHSIQYLATDFILFIDVS